MRASWQQLARKFVTLKSRSSEPQTNALDLTFIDDYAYAQHGPVIQKRRLARPAGVADLNRSAERKMLVATDSRREFKIVADASVGFYLYVFESGKCTHDYLQDSEELAKQCAADLFQVPLTSWKSKQEPIQSATDQRP